MYLYIYMFQYYIYIRLIGGLKTEWKNVPNHPPDYIYMYIHTPQAQQ